MKHHNRCCYQRVLYPSAISINALSDSEDDPFFPPTDFIGFPSDKENLEAFTRMERAIIIHKTCFMLSLIMLKAICRANTNILKVGEELQKESLELQSGSRIYQLEGLRPNYWYEVKISYPASIPASFSLQLKKESLNLEPKHHRKLLNTEKLIFKNDDTQQSGIYVMLTVESQGVVAISHVKEREMVIYNIVCDELALGIPHNAWWVVMFVILCLAVAFIIPSFLPPFLITRDQMPPSISKIS